MEDFMERQLLRGRLIPKTSRSPACKAGRHQDCIGTFQATKRDPIAHRARGILPCGCRCHDR